ncbi:unnamed protein product [Arabidopsis halleri]
MYFHEKKESRIHTFQCTRRNIDWLIKLPVRLPTP